MKKKALITGITGMDGGNLTDLLLANHYEVYGIIRRSSSFNTKRLEHCFNDIKLFYGDMTDYSSIDNILKEVKPDEIYNLAAQSHVKVSFSIPEYTAQVDAIGTLKLLESVRKNGLTFQCKIYNACSSEMFGNVLQVPQNENTPFNPMSPYGCSKVFSYYIAKNYREAYSMFISNGILFNHECANRGDTFVTKKITTYVKQIRDNGYRDISLKLGNLNAERDWGYSPDYVYGMWLMLQQDKPDDFVLATGEKHSVREFCEVAFKKINIDIEWQNKTINYEQGINKKTGEILIEVDPKYFRESEVCELLGDYSKAKNILGWLPKVKFNELIDLMLRGK